MGVACPKISRPKVECRSVKQIQLYRTRYQRTLPMKWARNYMKLTSKKAELSPCKTSNIAFGSVRHVWDNWDEIPICSLNPCIFIVTCICKLSCSQEPRRYQVRNDVFQASIKKFHTVLIPKGYHVALVAFLYVDEWSVALYSCRCIIRGAALFHYFHWSNYSFILSWDESNQIQIKNSLYIRLPMAFQPP